MQIVFCSGGNFGFEAEGTPLKQLINMSNFIKRIFVGKEFIGAEKIDSAYKQQVKSLRAVWNGSNYGVERVFHLFLCLIQFIYPTLLMKHIFGKRGAMSRKIAVEFYFLFKLFLPVAVLFLGFYRSTFIIILVIYLLSETIFNILNLIFLSDIYSMSVSYTRSILFLFLHYIEVVLDFAIIYLGFDVLNKPLSPVSAVYFSFVTNTTLGYGDYYPATIAGQAVAIFQLLIFIMFVVLFINYFSSRRNSKD